MQFTTVKRAVRAVHVDGADKDRAPEVEQVHGEVTFYPMMGDGDSVQVQTIDGPVTVVLTPITVRISDGLVMHRGGVGVQLFAGGKGSEPSLIRWRAVFRGLQSQGVPIKLRDVIFDAKPGGEVDLTTTAPLANAPEPIIRGPQGVSVDTIVVEGGDLVVWGRSESGRQILSRIKMSEITNPAAQAAADDTLAKLKATLDGKADKAETEQALGTKADQEATTKALGLKADKSTVTTELAKKADTTAVTSGLAGKAEKSHTHTSSDVTDARSAPTAGVVVKYDMNGLFTVGVPTVSAHPATKQYVDDGLAKKANASHTHTISNVTGLQSALDAKATATALTTGLNGKADKQHTHAQSDITGLDTALAGKSDTKHSHTWGSITGKPSSFSPSAHTHGTADVTGLDSALSGKADKTHSHTVSQVSGLAGELAARPNAWRIETAAELKATEAKARPGDIIHVVETGEEWKVS